MPFPVKLHYPIKWAASLIAIANEVVFSCEVANVFPVKWSISWEVANTRV